MTRWRARLLLAMTLVLLGRSPGLAQFDQGVTAFQGADYPAALQTWQQGAAAGDARAQYSLGYLYQFGLGVPFDLGKARGWYEKAAAANNADALYALGLLYEKGQAGGRDLTMAMSYYRKAAAAGPNADAEYAIGRMILRGRGVPRDAKEALVWLRKAAEQNHPAAQYLLGAAYEAGWGVRPDPLEALFWYRRAEQGDPVELEEQDVSFQPGIAIDALKRRLPAEAVASVEARLKKLPKAKPAPSSTKPANPAPAAKPGTAEAPPVKVPVNDGLPDALTRQP